MCNYFCHPTCGINHPCLEIEVAALACIVVCVTSSQIMDEMAAVVVLLQELMNLSRRWYPLLADTEQLSQKRVPVYSSMSANGID
jgi:hypothetical protein